MFLPKPKGGWAVLLVIVSVTATILAYSWQFLWGFPILPRKTDTSFLSKGTHYIKDAPQGTWFAWAAGWQRMLVRWVFLVVIFGGGWLYFYHPSAFSAVGITFTVLGIVAAIAMIVRSLRSVQHRRTYVEPLSRALAPALGIETPRRGSSWLTIPPAAVARVPLVRIPDTALTRRVRESDAWQTLARKWGKRPEHILPARLRRSPETAIRVQLPDGFTGSPEARTTVARIVASKLGIAELNASFGMVGKPIATFTRKVRPPDMAPWDQYISHVRSANESAPIIGIGAGNTGVSVDLDAESPHVMISAGSGGGKSVMARAILTQGLHSGGIALILDVKRVSHTWARGLDNVRYARSVEDIHAGLIWAKEEVDRRYDLIDEGADIDGNVAHIDLGPRIFILAEEMNATINRLSELWKEIKGKSDPPTSPAVKALGDILFMGRACKVHVIAIAQLMTARTLGGPEARENFSTRILARYSVNAWRMLVPEVWPPPRASRHPGRVQVVLAGSARETQVIFTTPAQAREYSGNGVVTPFPTLALPPTRTGADAPATRATDNPRSSTRADDCNAPQLDETGPSALSLTDAITENVVAVSIGVLRTARARDPEFPKPVAKKGRAWLYDRDALGAWERNRLSASVPVPPSPDGVIDLESARVIKILRERG